MNSFFDLLNNKALSIYKFQQINDSY
jgi:hypothetical protein